MRIVVITDVHANLPALRAVLEEVDQLGYDRIIHTGDAIGIGPYPAECLELLLNIPRIQFTLGNHDWLFVNGLPDQPSERMSKSEVEHQLWTHAQLTQEMRSQLALWPLSVEHDFDGFGVTFTHYGTSENRILPCVPNPGPADLDEMFSDTRGAFVFFGHDHAGADIRGTRRYLNPGSLGCSRKAVANYCVAEFSRGVSDIQMRSVPYDDEMLFQTFEKREVPARHGFYKTRFGGRYS